MRPLARADLTRFLAALARRLPCPATVVLTGGAEAMLLGGSRPTGDVDFGLSLSAPRERFLPAVQAAVGAAAAETGLRVQYSTDIDRWSSVSIPSARRATRSYRRLGRLSVRLLEPTCWAVYKLARYLDSDVTDLRAVLRRERRALLPRARTGDLGAAVRSRDGDRRLPPSRRHRHATRLSALLGLCASRPPCTPSAVMHPGSQRVGNSPRHRSPPTAVSATPSNERTTAGAKPRGRYHSSTSCAPGATGTAMSA